MIRYVLWWTAAFFLSFMTMTIIGQLTESDSGNNFVTIKARSLADAGMDLEVTPLAAAADGSGSSGDGERSAEVVPSEATSAGVTVETSSGDSKTSAEDGPREPAAFSLVAAVTTSTVTARVAPSATAEVIDEFANPVPSGAPLVFHVERSGTLSSPDWVEVQLPIQPNGMTGWVPKSDVSLFDNPYRLEVDRASYTLRVFDKNELIVETTIAVGTGSTPTPVGDFYLTELLAPPTADGPYGPFAFGLSGFSETLTSFGGADVAIIGLHGTNDPTSLGSDVSHGCVRLDNEVISQLAETLPLGTPVHIT
ncbi:MAG: L,D-transpeptidase family protein [Acidimicrobiales bacterium]